MSALWTKDRSVWSAILVDNNQIIRSLVVVIMRLTSDLYIKFRFWRMDIGIYLVTALVLSTGSPVVNGKCAEHIYYQHIMIFALLWTYNITVTHARHRASNTGNLKCFSTTCSGSHQRIHQNFVLLALWEGNPSVTGRFFLQRPSNADNVSMSWRHYDKQLCILELNLNFGFVILSPFWW